MELYGNNNSNKSCPTKIKVLVCTANIGNEKPDVASFNAWIPRNGDTSLILNAQRYPLRENVRKKFKAAVASLLGKDDKIEFANDEDDSFDDDDDDSFNDNDNNLNGSSSSGEKFDIIAIGMQEATFDVGPDKNHTKIGKNVRKLKSEVTDLTRSENYHKEDNNSGRIVGALRKIPSIVSGGGTPKEAKNKKFFDKKASEESLRTTSERNNSIDESKDTSKRGEDDTRLLHEMLQDQLPSYTRAVSYQRGQMRLLIFYNEDEITLDVLSVQGQNTGRAGLANKGGIVAECDINNGTRIAFLSAHLEAHEGESKYKTRCSTLGDILKGTESTVPAFSCDASLTSHFMFVMGDLNFRTKVPDYESGSNEHIEQVHSLVAKKDWKTLNRYDELAHALRNKHCLVGFKTLKCLFPPTFKVFRMDGYSYNEKRSPSYTDRILYKANHLLSGKIHPLAYEPIDNFTTSDHKPIRGAFELELNSPLRWRPVLVREFNSFRFMGRKGHKLRGSNLGKRDAPDESRREDLHLFVSSIACKISQEKYTSSEYSPSPYISFVTTPSDSLKKDSTKWRKVKSAFGLKQSLGKDWPQTKLAPNTCTPEWAEEVHFKVRTHDKAGRPENLTGAILHVLVRDGKDNSHLIGSCSLNLAYVIAVSRQQQQTMSIRDQDEDQQRPNLAIAFATRFMNKLEDAKGMIIRPSLNVENTKEAYKQWSDKEELKSNDMDVMEKIEEDKTILRGKNSASHPDSLHKSSTSNSQHAAVDKPLVLEEGNAASGIAMSGPSKALRNAYRASIFSSSTRRITQDALKKSVVASTGGHTSLDSLNIHSLRIDEPITKNGKEVGQINFTIDTWWLDDKVGQVMSPGRKSFSARRRAEN